jgi:hypothetical protein
MNYEPIPVLHRIKACEHRIARLKELDAPKSLISNETKILYQLQAEMIEALKVKK